MNSRSISHTEILDILPLGPPYLMLDRVYVQDGRARGTKNVSVSEPYFQGHFPNQPVMPGVLQVEAMIQLALVTSKLQMPDVDGAPFLQAVRKVKFRRPVFPGDRLDIEVAVERNEAGEINVTGAVRVGDDVTCEGTFALIMMDDAAQYCDPDIPNHVPTDCPHAADDNILGIMDAVPHRYPFLFVDRELYCDVRDDGKAIIIGLKNITAGDGLLCCVDGHPLYIDNILQIEAAAQTGCVHMLRQPEHKGKVGYFMSIEKSRFYRPVVIGDRLVIEILLTSSKDRFGRGDSRIFVDNDLVAEVTVKFVLLEPP